jgi:hypothetical protein
MVSKPEAARRPKSSHRPFFDLLDRMEETFRKNGAAWPEDVVAEARRRLARLERGVRRAPEANDAEW